MSFDGAGAPAAARFVGISEGITVLDMPGREEGRLLAPGDCLVVRADRAGEAKVGLKRGSADGALEATFRLDVIVRCEEEVKAAAPAAPAPVSFLAHVALVGDKPFAQGEWVAGPEAPGVIEGLQIFSEGDSPIEMQVLLGGRPPRWSDWVGAGAYAGTKGYGLPLLGVRLRLAPHAVDQEIDAQALFLGALVASQRGRTVEFVSGSGAEPLVGVKIAIVRTQERTPGVTGASDPASAGREPRVRVFRASTAR